MHYNNMTSCALSDFQNRQGLNSEQSETLNCCVTPEPLLCIVLVKYQYDVDAVLSVNNTHDILREAYHVI